MLRARANGGQRGNTGAVKPSCARPTRGCIRRHRGAHRRQLTRALERVLGQAVAGAAFTLQVGTGDDGGGVLVQTCRTNSYTGDGGSVTLLPGGAVFAGLGRRAHPIGRSPRGISADRRRAGLHRRVQEHVGQPVPGDGRERDWCERRHRGHGRRRRDRPRRPQKCRPAAPRSRPRQGSARAAPCRSAPAPRTSRRRITAAAAASAFRRGGAAALAGSVRTVAVTSGTVAVTSGFAAAGDSGAVEVSTIGGGRPQGPVR